MSTVLIDYGSGNLRSAQKALQAAAADPSDIVTSGDPDVVRAAERVVLPGVGAFRACMEALRARDGTGGGHDRGGAGARRALPGRVRGHAASGHARP